MKPCLANTPVIETDRLTLRAFGPQDVGPGVDYLMTDRTIHMGGPYSRHDAWIHCCHLIGHWTVHGYGLFTYALKDSDVPLGDVGPLFPEGWAEPELGWGVWASENEGKGYAFEAATAARNYVYDTLGWTTAVSYIDPENTRSIALAERLDCTHDPEAALPDLPDWEGTLVYRHPGPEALA